MSNMNSESHSPFWETLCGIIERFRSVDPPLSMVRSHYVPNTQERTTILDLIASNETSIRTLESTITDMRTAVSMLDAQLTGYKKCMEYHHSILSPVRKLPDELLGHIFSYACEDGIDVASFKANGTIWDICNVCFRWRDVAHHTPSLWCKVEIMNVELSEHNPTRKGVFMHSNSVVIRRTKLCLENSKSLPLTISCTPESFNDFPILAFAETVNVCDRWESLEIASPCIRYILREARLETVIQNRGLGQLRRLTVKEPCNSTPSVFRIFNYASTLRDVSFSEYIQLPSVEDFPWSLIKRLELSECDLEDRNASIPIFEAMTSLEALRWHGNFFHGQATHSILLPSLHTFSIVYNEEEEYDDHNEPPPRTLPLFRAPRLTTVRIIGDINQLQDLVAIVRNSGDSFTHLVLQDNSSNFIMKVVKEFTSVQDLTLDRVGCHDILQNLLQAPNTKEAQLLPSLKRLNLPYPNDSTVSLLMDIMRTRSHHSATLANQDNVVFTAPLSYVSIAATDSNNPSFLRLKDLGEELGIKVEV